MHPSVCAQVCAPKHPASPDSASHLRVASYNHLLCIHSPRHSTATRKHMHHSSAVRNMLAPMHLKQQPVSIMSCITSLPCMPISACEAHEHARVHEEHMLYGRCQAVEEQLQRHTLTLQSEHALTVHACACMMHPHATLTKGQHAAKCSVDGVLTPTDS